LKPEERKTTLNSAQDVSATGIQKHIAQDLMLVSDVEANITQPSAERLQTLQQNALCAEEITRPTIKTATYIKSCKAQETKQQSKTKAKLSQPHSTSINININSNDEFPPLKPNQTPVEISVNQQASYSHILLQNQHSLNISEQFPTFLNEFKLRSTN
jgi:hypothetical protein